MPKSAALTFELVELGLLVRCKDLVKGRVRFSSGRSQLCGQASDGGGDRANRGRVIVLNGGTQVLMRCFQAAAQSVLGCGSVGEDSGCFLLLGAREGQQSGEEADAVLHEVRGIRRVPWTLGEGQ